MYNYVKLGPVNIFMCDSESPINTPEFDSLQVRWLKPLLEAANARSGEFIAAMFHRPLYCSNGGSDCGTFAGLLKDVVEDMFKKNNVELVQSGHMHSYERTYPVYKGVVDNSSFVQVVNGLPGNKEPISRFRTKLPWSAFQYNMDYVYQVVEFSQATGADGQVHTTMNSNTFRSRDDSIVDKFSITSRR